jgi:hypothetical protein
MKRELIASARPIRQLVRREHSRYLPLGTLMLRPSILQQVIQRLGEVVHLCEMGRGQVLDQPIALLGEVDAHNAGVHVVLLAADEAGGLRAAD